MKIRVRLTALLVVILSLGVVPVVKSAEPQIITNSINMRLAEIPAGTFIMGSPPSEEYRDPKEERHEVTISRPFYMGIYEVTQDQYEAVMKDTRDYKNRSTFVGPDRPVENVEWQQANAYCELLSNLPAEKSAGRAYRLPTEAEWEYACRAGTTTAFHFGDSLSSEQANFNGNYPAGGAATGPYLRRTTNVGSYPANAFGLHDMHGNVAEWCLDWYDPAYYQVSPDVDPLGPPFGVVETKFDNADKNFFVVIRGGSWVDDARACRSAYRYRAFPNTQYRLIGFRVICTIER